MFCKNCGKELPDNAKFCSSCGTPTASPVPPQDLPPSQQEPETFRPDVDETVIPDPTAAADSPESAESAAPVLEDPEAALAQPAEPYAPANIPALDILQDIGAAEPSDPVKRRGKSGLVVIGGAAVVVIALIVLAVKLLPGIFGGGGGASYVYLNDDGELMYLADLKEKTQALELSDEANTYANVQFAPDGKTVYFRESDNTLYRISAAELKKGGKPERIAREVSYYSVLKDGRLIYVQYDGSDGSKLYLYDGVESIRLLRDYYKYQLSEDQKTLYYTEMDETDYTQTLYKLSLTKDAQEERLLKGADYIYTSYDADVLVYGVDDQTDDGFTTITVYSCVPGGDKTKLVSDAYSVDGVTVNGGKVDFYYCVRDVEERTLYDFVTDANASADAATLNGEEPVYPEWYDYFYDYDIDRERGVGYYVDIGGNRYDFEINSLLTDGRTVDDLYYWEIYSLASQAAEERYNAAWDDYSARYDVWSAAQNREYIRQNLKGSEYKQTSLSIYHYTGSEKGEPIATGVDSGGSRFINSAAGVLLYHKVSLEDGKVADVADLSYYSDVWDLLDSGSDDGQVWYQNVGGKESEADLDDVTSIYGLYLLNDKELVLDVYDGYDESLRSFSIGKDSLTFVSTIIEDDFAGPYRGTSSGSDVLYLFTDAVYDSKGTLADFCVYKGGKLETIAKEVYRVAMLDSSGTTYAITDFNSRNDTVELALALLKDGKLTTINDEVDGEAEPIFLDSAQILYISDDDLMLWNGKENRRIAQDVLYVWASTQEEYTAYGG